ncbi:MAG: HAMP domain-containing sensor histidine kinase [Candidatus Taylorbacteria bacterium]
MNIHLLIHDIVYSIDILLMIFFSLFALVKAKNNIAKVILLLLYAGVTIFITSHAIGVSVEDSELSRRILMFNLVDIFLPVFGIHCILALLGKHIEYRKTITLLYVIGVGLLAFFIINPRLFLVESVPKLYFPNYYEPGPYYWVMLLFFFGVVLYMFYQMRKLYLAASIIEKNRMKYFFIALILGYTIGSIDFLLIYNIPIDPVWGFLFVPFYCIPFTYAALNFELMNINIVAKRAFIYAIVSGVIGIALIFLNYINSLIIQSSPLFPNWLTSLVLAMIGAVAVLIVWRRIRETDVLKYEFISVITHKFRTPLTWVKWSVDNLAKGVPANLKPDVEHIQRANERLIDLTNLLVNLADPSDKSYEYRLAPTEVNKLIKIVCENCNSRAKAKNIHFETMLQSKGLVSVDTNKIQFVFQTLIDNAVTYTPSGGRISIETIDDNRFVTIRVSDTGIGISKEDLGYIFTKFYRTEKAMKSDTEGMGIGLFLSKKIVGKHGGKIRVESGGEGRGTSFVVSLPLLRN